MSEWIETKKQLPELGAEVLGMHYTAKRGWRPMICKLLKHNGDGTFWTINGACGPGINGPKWWMPIRESPQRRGGSL